ncbi:PucR family transcriptional regulator [Streptosporangiaceae bacterium NEAU-GS5]|nr:PucR family transcriptional regulator [Streptosporangiaceae bacterium NEAU-GS5]
MRGHAHAFDGTATAATCRCVVPASCEENGCPECTNLGVNVAPTLRRVTAIRALDLRVLAGREALDQPVRWVAVSELDDPTPFLEGHELVLTTGMTLTSDDAEPYVSRLVARGVAGLGFGVGLTHAAVPSTFVAAARAAGLPLIEVPKDTPFIAVGKAVSELLAAEQYEEISRAFAAQGRLTRAALQPAGLSAVIDLLAREIGGWAILFDESGEVRHAAGPWDEARARALAPEFARLRGGTPSILALATPSEHVIVQPLGRHGFFAVGAERTFSPIGHTIVNAAGSLLTLALEQGRGPRAAHSHIRAAALTLLLHTPPSTPPQSTPASTPPETAPSTPASVAAAVLADIAEELPAGPIAVLACATPDPDALADALPTFSAPRGDHTIVLAPETALDHIIEIIERTTAHGRVGVSPVIPALTAPDLTTALDQAERALAAAGDETPVVRFGDLAGQGLLSLIDPEAARTFAAALLEPLTRYGSRTDLVESLRVYLACNGHWDAAAQRLGVHRHTLRYRIRRAADLLARDLDDPSTRAELWLALSI